MQPMNRTYRQNMARRGPQAGIGGATQPGPERDMQMAQLQARKAPAQNPLTMAQRQTMNPGGQPLPPQANNAARQAMMAKMLRQRGGGGADTMLAPELGPMTGSIPQPTPLPGGTNPYTPMMPSPPPDMSTIQPGGAQLPTPLPGGSNPYVPMMPQPSYIPTTPQPTQRGVTSPGPVRQPPIMTTGPVRR